MIHLMYKRVPSPTIEETEEESEEESSDVEMGANAEVDVVHTNGLAQQNGRTRPRSVSPALPPSPISPPPSPARKRARTSSWKADSHIPEYLPPFPTSSPPPSPRSKVEKTPDVLQPELQDRPITPPPQLASSTTASDYLTEVPYSMSALAPTSELHLPEMPDALKLFAPSPVKRNLPGTQQSLVHAYHYILTNPPPPQQTVNPLRHKVAMSLLTQMYTSPRWTAADTLYANLSPPRPRVVAPSPSLPVPIVTPMESEKGKEKKQLLLPNAASRTVVASETVIPLSAQPQSRIPEVMRQVLSVSIISGFHECLGIIDLQHYFQPALYSRATKLLPPPLQTSATERFVYGPGVPAPWNSSNSAATAVAEGSGKNKELANGQKDGSSKGEAKPDVVPDATLYATWDWEMKDYRLPINHPKNKRAGSFSIGGGPPNGLHHRPSISLRAGSAGVESSSSRKGSKLVIKGDGKGK